MAFSQERARSLSDRQRQFLLRHIDGPVQVNVFDSRTLYPLVAKGLIRCDRPVRPKMTSLTPDGRYALGVILGDAADVLSSTGVIDEETTRRIMLFVECRKERIGTGFVPGQNTSP